MDINNVLEAIRQKIEAIDPLDDKFLRSRGNDNGFEELFPIIANQVANDISSDNKLIIVINSGHHFPDIDLYLDGIKYGVELKSRNNGTWSTNGNSVLESITGEDYEDIFIVFASKVPGEKRLLIRFAPYWQTTASIKVTHSPRFTINMDTENSVFSSKEEYNYLREQSEEYKVSFLQEHLRESNIGAGAKWYVAPNDPVFTTPFNDLPIEKQEQLTIESLILFPDDILIGSNKTKYVRSSKYLIETHSVYNSSIRDMFSAGGVYPIKNVNFPNIIGRLILNKEILIDALNNASPDFIELAKESWSKNLPEHLITDNLYDSYKKILDYIGHHDNFSSKLKQINVTNLSELIL